MLSTPLQPQYKFKVNVRPVKYAYFVWQDDAENLERVLRLVCTQWGGLHSLIIPVRRDLGIAPIFEELLKLHEPDWFVSFLEGSTATNHENHDQLQRYLRKLWPNRKFSLERGDYFEQNDLTAHALGVVPSEELDEKTLTVHDFAGSEEQTILLTLFGAIYPGQHKDYVEKIGIREVKVGIRTANFWESQFDNSPFSSVLNLTSYGVSPYKVTKPFESNHFDVVLASSVNSLCMFWNLRATKDAAQFRKDMGRRTLLLPDEHTDDSDLLEGMLSFIRSRLAYPGISTNLHLCFCVWSKTDREKLESAVRTLDALEESSENRHTITHTSGRDALRQVEDFSDQPLRYRFTLPGFPRSFFVGVRDQVAYRTQLDPGTNEVFFTPPERFRNRFGGTTALDFVCDVWSRYPNEHRIAESIKSGSWFSRYGLSFVAATADHPHYIGFNLPDEWETLRLFFAVRGYDIRLSRPGTYANALIELVGGLQHMDLLASKPTYLLLDTLALKSTKKLAQRIVKQLGGSEEEVERIQPLLENMEIVPELKRIPKTYRQLASGSLSPYRKELLQLLSRLSARQIVKRGFYLTCASCGTPTWHPLRSVQEVMVCPGCSSELPLPVEYPPGSGQEIKWEYTLNTLVNRAVDQDVLPAMLAIHHLTESKQACCIVPGLELLQSDSVKAELDFVFISDHQLFVGECKAGTKIGEKDLKTAKLAADLGVHHFYYCTVAQFSDTSRKQIEELKSEFEAGQVYMDLTILEGAELLGGAID